MIVICEECGKKYKVDPSKIQGKDARFKCKACNNLITVDKPEDNPTPFSIELPATEPTAALDVNDLIARPSKPEPAKSPLGKRKKMKPEKKKSKFLGLRSKMILLFMVVPLLLIAAAGALYLVQMKQLTTTLIDDSYETISKMAESRVADMARSVAQQCKLYLVSNPGLRPEDFNFGTEFKRIAIQKVGKTGYTSLYSIAQDGEAVTLWMHPDPNLIGVPLGATMQKVLGSDFKAFEKITANAEKGQNAEASGYYVWMDPDGQKRDKFMVITPIEGTRFGISSSTYLDEFTQPVVNMRERARREADQAVMIILGILGGTIMLIAIIVSVYGHKLVGRIKSLTEVAERISVGELEAEIESGSGDELGDLGEAILRMQDSIRLSIERLRRRR